MQLLSLSANDSRFKDVHFRAGLNLIVADRSESSTQGESRNGTGKTSLVLLIRYLLGGNLPSRFKREQFSNWVFELDLLLPGNDGEDDHVTVRRAVASPRTKLSVHGWSRLQNNADQQKLTDWKAAQERHLFSIPRQRPNELTSQALWGYFIRDQFGKPTRAVNTDADWLVGLKLGYLLGLAPSVLAMAGGVASLERQRKALKEAMDEGALMHLDLNEAQLRSDIAGATREKERLARDLENFRVDDAYEDNQRQANKLSQQIRDINEQLVTLRNRASELRRSIEDEEDVAHDRNERRLGVMYQELGLVIPDNVAKRFEEVAEFHRSVVRNRAQYLKAEFDDVTAQIENLSSLRRDLDRQRAEMMTLLQSSVAFETFIEAQVRVADLEGKIADMQRHLQTATSVSALDTTIKTTRVEAERTVRQELRDREEFLINQPLALFKELGDEIYDDRSADLLLDVNKNGGLSIKPQLSGDESDGIRGVETFLLDITTLITSMSINRSPGLLVHDSHLFDAVDHRQVASCLNIGARLAEQHGFQYVVTMNSDFLASVEKEGSFDGAPYRLDVGLNDAQADGGLFGFKFD